MNPPLPPQALQRFKVLDLTRVRAGPTAVIASATANISQSSTTVIVVIARTDQPQGAKSVVPRRRRLCQSSPANAAPASINVASGTIASPEVEACAIVMVRFGDMSVGEMLLLRPASAAAESTGHATAAVIR